MSISLHSWVSHIECDLSVTTDTGASAETSKRRVVELAVNSSREQLLVVPKLVVDASGESTVSQLAGERSLLDESFQAGAVVFDIAPVDESNYRYLHDLIVSEVLGGVESGELPAGCRQISLVPGSLKDRKVSIKISLPDLMDPDPQAITRGEINARSLVAATYQYLRSRLACMSAAGLHSVAAQVGVRTGIRGIGEYQLSGDDVLKTATFPDVIAHGVWPMEWWDHRPRPALEFFAEDTHYEIPARCLFSRELHNLLFAGRMISASKEAISSARVIGTCLATGYAAGVMAGSMARGSSRAEAIQLAKNFLTPA